MKRKWIFCLLTIVFVWVLVSHFAEVRKLTLTLSQGQWQWILAAVLVQVVFYCFYAGVYRAAFHVVDVPGYVQPAHRGSCHCARQLWR